MPLYKAKVIEQEKYLPLLANDSSSGDGHPNLNKNNELA
jgi:hypothetical protein